MLIDYDIHRIPIGEIAQKYGYSLSGARGTISRYRAHAKRDPAIARELMRALVITPPVNEQQEAQQAIINKSKAAYDKHLKKHPAGRVAWLSDIHIPYARLDALQLAYQFVEYLSPQWITTLNDLFDFGEYSRWENAETLSSMLWKSDFSNTLKIADIHHTMLLSVAPHARLIGLGGNHDKWMLQYLRMHANGWAERNITTYLSTLHKQGVLVMTADHVQEPVAKLGALKLVHGVSAAAMDSTLGKKTIETMSEGREAYYTASGHVHRSFTYKHMGVKHFNFGCLCIQSMPYMKHKSNKWELGMGVLDYTPHNVEGEAINFYEERGALVAYYRGKRFDTKLDKQGDSFAIW